MQGRRHSEKRVRARMGVRSIIAGLSLVLVLSAPALGRGELFENTVRVLGEHFYDKAFRTEVLPGLVEKYRPDADAARSRDAERRVVSELLSEIPASHLALISIDEYRTMLHELNNDPRPTFGVELVEREGGLYVLSVLDGGPADRAGLLRGDRVTRIDGAPALACPRLDWRSDDAALPDPPVHRLLGEIGDGIDITIERRPDEFLTMNLVATNYSAFEAMKRGARIIEHDGEPVAYIHLWFIHIKGLDRLLAQDMRRQFRSAAALIVDLRGRGGSADMAIRVVRLLKDYREKSGKPVIVLIDAMTRSAKEVIAYGIRQYDIGTLVGQRTAGAVLPASFEKVDDETVLMFPSFRLPRYSDLIEGIGVAPDVAIEPAGLFSAGADPILGAGLDEAARQVRAHRAEKAVVPE